MKNPGGQMINGDVMQNGDPDMSVGIAEDAGCGREHQTSNEP